MDEPTETAQATEPTVHVATENAGELLGKLRHAGAIFLGNYTPVARGDYAAGPSHVLPTSGTSATPATIRPAPPIITGRSAIC